MRIKITEDSFRKMIARSVSEALTRGGRRVLREYWDGGEEDELGLRAHEAIAALRALEDCMSENGVDGDVPLLCARTRDAIGKIIG